MALANFTDLKARVAADLSRADLTSLIPDFILQAEEEFNNTLRVPQQETRSSFTISGEYVTAPTDFLEFRSGYLESSPRRPLEYLSPSMQTQTYGDVTNRDASRPCYFSRVGNQFRFAPVPSSAIDATIVYYATIPPLALNATNWLLTRAPSLYLYQSVLQGMLYLQDERAGAIVQLYDRAYQRFMESATRSRWGGPAMAVRVV